MTKMPDINCKQKSNKQKKSWKDAEKATEIGLTKGNNNHNKMHMQEEKAEETV